MSKQTLNASNIYTPHNPLRVSEVTQVMKPDPGQSSFRAAFKERMPRIANRLFCIRPSEDERTLVETVQLAEQFQRIVSEGGTCRVLPFFEASTVRVRR